MKVRHYLRPTAFVDAPFGLDSRAVRLVGGMAWFSAVELVSDEEGDLSSDLVPVSEIEARLDGLGESALMAWRNLVEPRAPLRLGVRSVPLDQPQVVGIVNPTPDSFSDGGRYEDAEAAAAAGCAMAEAGAAIIDVGGESTRPGAKPIWEGDEEARILPVVESIARAGNAVSIDSRKAGVMSAALGAGATMVNDVSALTFDERSAGVVAAARCAVVLMHHKGSPETMQDAPSYGRPVLLEVYDWLAARIEAAEAAGIARDRFIVDPGIGFGKSVKHNLDLLNGVAMLHGLGCPIMIGASRKRMIGALAGEAPADRRLGGSVALAVAAAAHGVQLLRVHDVAETVQALRVWRGMRDAALAAPPYRL